LVGQRERMVTDEPAVELPQRDLWWRALLPVAGAPGPQPGKTPAHAGVDVPVPVAGVRGQVSRAAPRHAGAGSGARQPVPADSPTARRRAPRTVPPLGRPARPAPATGAHRALVDGCRMHPELPGHAVCRLRLGAWRATRHGAATVSGA